MLAGVDYTVRIGPRVGGPILPTVWLTADIARLQQDVLREGSALDKIVVKCLPKLSADEIAQWNALFDRVQKFVAETPATLNTSPQADAGQAIQRDLVPWHDKLKKCGVDPGPPPTSAATAPPSPVAAALAAMPPVLLVLGLLLLARQFKR